MSSLHPAKPFVTRGANAIRCESCLLPVLGCICDYRFQIRSSYRFALLMHRYESFKPTNTGRLIADCLADTQCYGWNRLEPDPRLIALINDPQQQPVLVFPEGDDYKDRMITADQLDTNKQVVLIILDGTWRQARRMFRHSRYLDSLPVIQPELTKTSRYQLRKASDPSHLCTVEVAAALLEQLGDALAAEHLDNYFGIFNEHYARARKHFPMLQDTEEKLRWRGLYEQLASRRLG